MIKAIFFDIDNTLYDSAKLADRARNNAVYAMIDAGLKCGFKKARSTLEKAVREVGPNYPEHYRILLKKLGIRWNPEIIAAGVVAYHDTKLSYLKPFPDTVPVLLKFRDDGYKLGVISDGLAVKQWDKLIRLGIHHFFHSVVISEIAGYEKPDVRIFKKAVKEIGCKPEDALMVGDKPDVDIKGAKKAGMKTVLVGKGKGADYNIEGLRELPAVLRKIK